MKKLLFTAFLLQATCTSLAQQLPADKITGTWESVESDVGLKFLIFKSGNEYCGRLLWASTMFEPDGKTAKKDFNNPDESLKSRSRQNILNITRLRYSNGAYTEGKLYNPDDGNTYSLKARLQTENELEFRGYTGVSLLGKTMKFKRAN